MNDCLRKKIGAALSAAVFALNYSPWVQAEARNLSGARAAQASASVAGRMLIPGGQVVGVALKTEGVLVVARGNQSGQGSELRVGDVILSVMGQKVDSAKDLQALVNASYTDQVEMSVLRRGRAVTVNAQAGRDGVDGPRRLGVWVRDSTAGVGTLSYIDPLSGAYGALGHAIVDGDTGDMVVVREGAILSADVVGIARGDSTRAGELRGSFLKENRQIGSLDLNSVFGIYGIMDVPSGNAIYPDGLPVAGRDEVRTGPAEILATVDGEGMRAYSVEITKCVRQDAPAQKGITLRVTDERLLAKTGGIVQGMSGSPIIQNGKIVGAVTHVYLSDSAQGYGMYIEWMLEQSDRIGKNRSADAA